MTVLIVDDEKDLRDTITRIVARKLHEDVVSARSAREAISTFESRPIRLLLTDHRMPGESGLDLIAQVRRRWPETKCVLVTAENEVHATAQYAEVAPDALVEKPFRIRELEAVLDAMRPRGSTKASR